MRSPFKAHKRLTLACLSLFLPVMAAAQTAPTENVIDISNKSQRPLNSAASPEGGKILPLEVTVNGANVGQWPLLQRDGALFAPSIAFEEWRINRRPNTPEFSYRGQIWYPLNAVPGFESKFNFANQSVDLSFSPVAFSSTRLTRDVTQGPLIITPASLAAFVNYDFNFNNTRIKNAGSVSALGTVMEFGVSNSWGVLTSSHLGQNLGSNSLDAPQTWRRLETVYKKDFVESSTSLRIGDSVTRTSIFGVSLYFGGIQIARNFALRPGFTTQPIPALAGTSSAASTVDLYINDTLRQTSKVPAGPFTLDNFPLVTGAGEARIVIRDLLGRETVLVQPFFTHSDLLEEGLSDWSVELGRVRNNLGTDNANYGLPIASGIYRYGINKEVTLAGDIKRTSQGRTVAAGLNFTLPFQALGIASVSSSKSQFAPKGTRWSVGFEQTSLRHGITFRMERASRNYREADWSAATLPNRTQISGSYSYSSGQWGAIGFGYAKVKPFDAQPITSLSTNYSLQLAKRGTISITATKVLGPSPGKSLGFSILFPLENATVLSASITNRAGQLESYASASRALGAETGFGWRALVGKRAELAYSEGGINYQGTKIALNADINANRTQQATRLGAQGGLVLMGGSLFASRRIENSFALVEVPGYANVGVGFQGSTLTQTDADGIALVTRLQPYQNNHIRLDPTELPINAELDSIEQTVVPAAQTGVRVLFPVRSGRGALIKIVFDDGEPAPPGAEVELVGDTKPFFVARRGETFVTGLQTQNTLRITRNGATCNIDVQLPDADPESIPRVGPLLCSGVTR